MKKTLFSAAIALTALSAAPAAAQWTPQPYGAPYGYAYGYQNNFGQARSLEVRVNHLQRQIQRLDQRNILSDREARRLRERAWDIKQDLRRASFDGLNQWEANRFHQRIAELEFRIQRQARDLNRRWGDQRYGDANWDRDRDGRDDRWEREHDQWHDRHDDDDDDD